MTYGLHTKKVLRVASLLLGSIL